MIRAIALIISFWAAPVAAQNIMVIGDSIMAWNTGSNSVPAQLALTLNVAVDDRAVLGARMSTGFLGRLAGQDIPAQMQNARPDILILTGGGNDLGQGCGCQNCDATLQGLIDPAGGGSLGQFLQDQLRRGVDVIYLGYYRPPVGGNGFSGCLPWLLEIDRRVMAMAQANPGLTFVSAADVIDQSDLSLYDRDRVHPSPKAAALIAALLADTIAALPPR